LYIVSSRYEGGPRSIFEAGATKTPIISTKVGIAEDILPKESLYDMHNYITYKEAKPNVDELYKNIQILNSKTQIREIKNYLLSI
jgi:glycosyltransferase involved in cell wall biosynthesis